MSIERRIVTGLIVSASYIEDFIKIYHSDYIDSESAETLISWVLDYFSKHKKAPERKIEELFQSKLSTGKIQSKEVEQDIAEILEGLSRDYERTYADFDPAILIEDTENYFQKQQLIMLKEDIGECLDKGDVPEAHKLLAETKPVKLISVSSGKLLENKEAVFGAFDMNYEPLIRFGGALGELLDHQFVRDSFVGITAPEKRGKSFWLQEVAFQAHRSGSSVVYFEVGDMTEKQILRRMGVSLSGRHYMEKYCRPDYIPTLDCTHSQMGSCTRDEFITRDHYPFKEYKKSQIGKLSYWDLIGSVKSFDQYKSCTACRDCKKSDFDPALWYWLRGKQEPLTKEDAWELFQRQLERYGNNFRVEIFPRNLTTVEDLHTLLQEWERTQNFVPDVVVIDYADVLAPEKGQRDGRDVHNERWGRLRRLSQDWSSCVVTATQSNSMGSQASNLTDQHFSEDKRKNSHVTGMVVLNQDLVEKKKGLLRVGVTLSREEDFDPFSTVTVLERRSMGRIFLDSYPTPIDNQFKSK